MNEQFRTRMWVGMSVVLACVIAVAIGMVLPSQRAHATLRSGKNTGAMPRATVNPDKARNTVKNGGFETTGGWTYGGAKVVATLGAITPERGKKFLNMNGGDVMQEFLVPSTAPYLRYSYQIRNATAGCADGLGIDFNMSSGTWMKDVIVPICTTKNTTKWVTGTIDLRTKVGKKVFIDIYVIADGTEQIALDDIGFVSAATRPVDYY